MPTKSWSIVRFALVGALIGGVYAAFQAGPYWAAGGDLVARGVGNVVGGVVGGAFILALIAAIRNWATRR